MRFHRITIVHFKKRFQIPYLVEIITLIHLKFYGCVRESQFDIHTYKEIKFYHFFPYCSSIVNLKL